MKYKLTDDTRVVDGITLHRIECVEEFSASRFSTLEVCEIKVGDKGGWIEKEENLSQEGNCWVYNDAIVCQNAKVCDDAIVRDYAMIYDNAIISEKASIGNFAHVFENAKVYGKAMVFINARVYGNSNIYGNAQVYDDSSVYGNAHVFENGWVLGNAKVFDNAQVFGGSNISGDAQIAGDAKTILTGDYITFQNNWSNCKSFTWTRSNNMWTEDRFNYTGEELIKKAYEDSENSGKHYEAYVKLVEQLQEIENTKTNE